MANAPSKIPYQSPRWILAARACFEKFSETYFLSVRHPSPSAHSSTHFQGKRVQLERGTKSIRVRTLRLTFCEVSYPNGAISTHRLSKHTRGGLDESLSLDFLGMWEATTSLYDGCSCVVLPAHFELSGFILDSPWPQVLP